MGAMLRLRSISMLDDLLPVVVFETLEGLLLVDRYHRVAPRHLGLETVEADVRRGSRHDASCREPRR